MENTDVINSQNKKKKFIFMPHQMTHGLLHGIKKLKLN